MPNWVASFHWEDNNGQKAQTRLHYSGELTLAAVVSRATAAANAQMDVSTARIIGFELAKTFQLAGAEPAALTSDTKSNLLLFYGNSTSAAAFRVPSPRPLPVDLVGPYRNVRLDLAAVEVSTLLTPLGSSLAGTLTPGGDAWPMPLLAGGYTRYQGGI